MREHILAFVLRGKNRRAVLQALQGSEKAAAQLAGDTGMYPSHLSRTLHELLDRRLIRCTNPGDRSFRFYVLTSKGKTTLQQAADILGPPLKKSA